MIRWRDRRSRRVLVLGGARSGKSLLAETMLHQEKGVRYVACGPVPDSTDPEWSARVEQHRLRRPSHWTTLETCDLVPVLRTTGGATLIDCLSTWLAAVMDDCRVWDGVPGADVILDKRVDQLVQAWAGAAHRVVAVSNEVGSGIVPATSSGRRFRDELGTVNARLAAASDAVWLVTAGIPQRMR